MLKTFAEQIKTVVNSGGMFAVWWDVLACQVIYFSVTGGKWCGATGKHGHDVTHTKWSSRKVPLGLQDE